MTPEQVRMARGALRIGVRDLAAMAEVSFTTISRFETGKGGLQHSSAEAIQSALESHGIQFLRGGDIARGLGIAVNKAGASEE
ncbi:hypothetical protein SAMN04488523_105315 [Sulfitobacter brevis]|uniref:HTH cro/C1-type domain-containing protein n=1 Tax=Sulfitobacter brevis TaxID=74348 RepID=A0A1I1YMC7_9RHOB|nr:hypothetical protein SAMN04488523_105315 [Sulfitobacter brevis]